MIAFFRYPYATYRFYASIASPLLDHAEPAQARNFRWIQDRVLPPSWPHLRHSSGCRWDLSYPPLRDHEIRRLNRAKTMKAEDSL